MKSFFAPNIERRGRIARAVLGVLLVAAGIAACRWSYLACAALVVSGGFTLYEASRGWCVMRACGIRTRL